MIRFELGFIFESNSKAAVYTKWLKTKIKIEQI